MAAHEIQNLHQDYKEDIQKFIMGHFLAQRLLTWIKPCSFFTSGRYEYKQGL
ncbi:MAG: hypothetical protein R3B47_14865 [Bacteroidia bacterium]